LLNESTQGADLDLGQRGPGSFVTEQILRNLEQVHELLVRGELHLVADMFVVKSRLRERVGSTSRSFVPSH
jgi:hypothetical protein